MLNPQVLNNLEPFFVAFKEALLIAAKPEQLDTVIAGLSDAKATLAQAAAAKPALDELETFKTTKAEQLQSIADGRAAVEEAARLNTEHAQLLTDANAELDSQRIQYKADVTSLGEREDAVKAREDSVEQAQSDAKVAQDKADQALVDANDLKQAYIAKLKALASTEGASDVASSS